MSTMKKIILCSLPLLLALVFSACNKSDDTISCDPADCTFVLAEQSGTIVQMNCFSRLAIQTKSPSDSSIKIYGLPDQELPVELASPEIEVLFTAKFRENTIEPQFPDPSIGPETIYQLDVIDIRQQ